MSKSHSNNIASGEKRYESLDGVRGIAAICVMIYHFSQQTSHPIMNHAYLAVDLFFMLSGFVLCHAYQNKVTRGKLSFTNLFLRRLIRLYPMFAIGLGLGLIVEWISITKGISSYTVREFLGAAITNAAFLPYLYSGYVFPADNPEWSLFFEMCASLCFWRLTSLRTASIAKWSLFWLATMIASAGYVFIKKNHSLGLEWGLGWGAANVLGGFPRVMYGFVSGMLIYRASKKIFLPAHRSGLRQRLTLVTPITFAVIVLAFSVQKEYKGLYSLGVALTVIPVAIIVAQFVNDEPKGISNRLNKGLGWISYPLYCLHMPIWGLTRLAASSLDPVHTRDALVLLISASLASFAAALLCGIFLDEPMRKWLSDQLAAGKRITRTA